MTDAESHRPPPRFGLLSFMVRAREADPDLYNQVLDYLKNDPTENNKDIYLLVKELEPLPEPVHAHLH